MKSEGYSPSRFGTATGRTTDEIALNPRYFRDLSFIEIIGVLAHEMVHLWQQHFGKPSRNGYHNKQWAGEMLRIGLHPSHTGKPGGRMTGQQMMHYIIEGGLFERAAKELEANLGITWFDVNAVALLSDQSRDPFEKRMRRRRITFKCPTCSTQATSKPGANLVCGDCELEMEPVDLW
jgi:predicted SprT family Zn-dependent metalloprotease